MTNDPQPKPAVTYLYVPFADKNEVKALGARWDAEARSWYVPTGVATAPFARWFHVPPIAERPLYLELETAERNHEDLLYLAQVGTPVEVVLMSYECWQCHQYAPVFYGLADERGLLVLEALYWPETIGEIHSFRKRKELVPLGTVRPRFSKTLGRRSVSQGCPRCDALFGNYLIGQAALDHSIDLPADYPYRFVLEEWPPPSLSEYLNGLGC